MAQLPSCLGQWGLTMSHQRDTALGVCVCCVPLDPFQARGLLTDLVVVSRHLLLHRVCGFLLERGASNHLTIDLEKYVQS